MILSERHCWGFNKVATANALVYQWYPIRPVSHLWYGKHKLDNALQDSCLQKNGNSVRALRLLRRRRTHWPTAAWTSMSPLVISVIFRFQHGECNNVIHSWIHSWMSHACAETKQTHCNLREACRMSKDCNDPMLWHPWMNPKQTHTVMLHWKVDASLEWKP